MVGGPLSAGRRAIVRARRAARERGRLPHVGIASVRCLAALLAPLALSAPALALAAESRAPTTAHVANTSHAGWPPITGMTLLNKNDQDRPLDGRPGHDPFDSKDRSYSCDGYNNYTRCGGGTRFFGEGPETPLRCRTARSRCPYQYTHSNLVPASIGHNELLGGHGNDTIYAGPAGDVIWGDYKPSEQPTSQVDHLKGGRGSDWLYASHGTNYITTGAGNDHVLLVYGHGVVRCDGPGHKTIVLPKLPKNRHYQLIGCTSKTIVPFAV